MKIFLIGLPGSGKSTMGPVLARHLNYGFSDLDACIEAGEKCSIPEIFASRGEADFRKKEQHYLRNTFHKIGDHVIACGGGTPMFFDNMVEMQNQGLIVFLNPPISEIAKRLAKPESTIRPVFENASDLQASLEKLMSIRISTYQQSHLQYSGSDVSELAALVQKHF
jgi:shikimate kinase